MRYFVGKVNSTFGWDTRAHFKKRNKVKKNTKIYIKHLFWTQTCAKLLTCYSCS